MLSIVAIDRNNELTINTFVNHWYTMIKGSCPFKGIPIIDKVIDNTDSILILLFPKMKKNDRDSLKNTMHSSISQLDECKRQTEILSQENDSLKNDIVVLNMQLSEHNFVKKDDEMRSISRLNDFKEQVEKLTNENDSLNKVIHDLQNQLVSSEQEKQLLLQTITQIQQNPILDLYVSIGRE